MSWYWIVLIVLAYLFLWASTTAAMRKIDENDDIGGIGCIVIGFLWPITFLVAIIYNLSTVMLKSMKKKEEQK